MVQLVYCDNTGEKGEGELDRILAGTRTIGCARRGRAENSVQL